MVVNSAETATARATMGDFHRLQHCPSIARRIATTQQDICVSLDISEIRGCARDATSNSIVSTAVDNTNKSPRERVQADLDKMLYTWVINQVNKTRTTSLILHIAKV